MIRHILVPLDGSDVAESILPCVRSFARLMSASMTLVQVVEPLAEFLDQAGEEAIPMSAEVQAVSEKEAREYLARVASDGLREGIVTHTHVAYGSPAEEVIHIARGFDLVAMATHGRSGVGRWVYGSVADKVLRGASVPVLLVRAQDVAPVMACQPTRILVPLDGSALAEHALPLAMAAARMARADILLTRCINLVRDVGIGVGALGATDAVSLLEIAESGARAYLEQVAERITRQGLRVTTDVRLDSPASGILDSASSLQADLIVMCTHGRGGIGRWVYGSVADRVLRSATLPVLLVRASVPVRFGSSYENASLSA